jgi:hypothetical protein
MSPCLSDLRDEAILTCGERGGSLLQARKALANGDKRAPFTEAEIVKREARLPRLRAIRNGLTALEARRAELPDWVLAAFEGEWV